MTMRMEQNGEEMTVYLSGEIDHHSARALREQIDAAVEKSRPNRLRLNFEGVTFMDSSGIGLVMGRYRLMQLYEGGLEVTGLSDRIRRVMALAGLNRLGILNEEKSGAISDTDKK